MARIALDAFGEGTELVRVYLAQALGEARAVEAVLDGTGLRFAVEVEQVPVRSLLGGLSARTAVGFWVEPGDVAPCAAALERAGHLKGLVDATEGA
jgi:hypothetical protein